MYNRYQGNTGRYVRVQEPPPRNRVPPAPPVPARRPPPSPGGGLGSLFPSLGGITSALSDGLTGILPKVLPDGLELDDLLLLLVLYLMYKESGDKELLIIMGAMFFL